MSPRFVTLAAFALIALSASVAHADELKVKFQSAPNKSLCEVVMSWHPEGRGTPGCTVKFTGDDLVNDKTRTKKCPSGQGINNVNHRQSHIQIYSRRKNCQRGQNCRCEATVNQVRAKNKGKPGVGADQFDSDGETCTQGSGPNKGCKSRIALNPTAIYIFPNVGSGKCKRTHCTKP